VSTWFLCNGARVYIQPEPPLRLIPTTLAEACECCGRDLRDNALLTSDGLAVTCLPCGKVYPTRRAGR
jgi:hypothetical protein